VIYQLIKGYRYTNAATVASNSYSLNASNIKRRNIKVLQTVGQNALGLAFLKRARSVIWALMLLFLGDLFLYWHSCCLHFELLGFGVRGLLLRSCMMQMQV
jgi:hypothetical protein